MYIYNLSFNFVSYTFLYSYSVWCYQVGRICFQNSYFIFEIIDSKRTYSNLLSIVSIQVLCLNYNHIESITGKPKGSQVASSPFHAKILNDNAELSSPLLDKLEVLHLGFVLLFSYKSLTVILLARSNSNCKINIISIFSVKSMLITQLFQLIAGVILAWEIWGTVMGNPGIVLYDIINKLFSAPVHIQRV